MAATLAETILGYAVLLYATVASREAGDKPTGTKLQDANFAQRSCPEGEAQGCAE